MIAMTLEQVQAHFAAQAKASADAERARVDAARDSAVQTEMEKLQEASRQARAVHDERESSHWMTREQREHRAKTKEWAKADESLSPRERSEVARARMIEGQRAAFVAPGREYPTSTKEIEDARRKLIESANANRRGAK